MRFRLLGTLLLLALPTLARAQATNSDELPANFLANTKPLMHGFSAAGGAGHLGTRTSGGVLGVDSVLNWGGSFYDPGVDGFGNAQYTWQYTMVGRSPQSRHQGEDDDEFEGSTTKIGAPVIPVNLDLRNFDGSPRYVNGQRLYVDATQYVQPVLKSPVFSDATYSSSQVPTQFADAVQRAEFFNTANYDWHTLLKPRVATTRTIQLVRGTYRYALNPDGTCCAYVLVDEGAFFNALFPATPTDTTTPIGAAENSGEFKTKDIGTFLFNNVFLYAPGDPTNCCVLGFHSYDVEPGNKANGWQEKRFVMNFSSWVSPGLFGTSFADVTALSHEMSELFNDPFVNNATPIWVAPNGNCQNNLEVGDVTEGLPNSTTTYVMNGRTYHPQTEALLQWFAGVTPSNAIQGAYSYPNTSLLTAAAVSSGTNCKPLP